MSNAKLDGLLALKLVAEKRNFTAAANELGISPSAISQIVKQLERRLGVALLNRTTRSTSLTEAGERFLAQVRPALDQILLAFDDVGSFAKKPSGLLRLNMPRLIYSTYLAPIVSSFIEKYPEVSIEIFFEDQVSDIVDSGFDAGIRLSEILAHDMIAIKLYGPVRFVTVGSSKYFDKMGRPKHPRDLLTHNCIRPRLGTSYIYDRWEFEDKGKEFQVHVKGSLIFNDAIFMIKAATEGHGIVYTTEESVTNLITSGEIEIVLGQFALTSAGFYLYYPKSSQALLKLRVFIDHIKNYSS